MAGHTEEALESIYDLLSEKVSKIRTGKGRGKIEATQTGADAEAAAEARIMRR